MLPGVQLFHGGKGRKKQPWDHNSPCFFRYFAVLVGLLDKGHSVTCSHLIAGRHRPEWISGTFLPCFLNQLRAQSFAVS